MTLENEVLDSLEDLKYADFETIKNNVSLLTDVTTFSSIISWISNQMQKMDGFESTVNPIKDESEMVSFKIELNSLLRELNCPLIDSDLSDSKTKLSLLNSLCGHLMSSIMIYSGVESPTNESMNISMTESQTAKDLKYILITLGEKRKPPNNVSPNVIFNTIKDLLNKKISQQNPIEDSLLLPEGINLSPEQWKSLETMNNELFEDFSIRRQMLLKRCDTTVNSFTWRTDKDNDSDEIKAQINDSIGEKRKHLSNTPNLTLANALAARQSDCDSLINGMVSKNKTCCLIQTPDTKGIANKGREQQNQQRIQAEELHKFRIGAVPDRGGRPNEQPKPPKENFAQQKFQRDNPQRGRGRGGYSGGGGGGGGGGRGAGPPRDIPKDRIQGSSWAQNSGDRYSYDNQRRGHQSNNYHQNDGQHYRNQPTDNYQQSSGHHYQQQQQYQSQPQRQQQYSQQNFYQNNEQYGQQYDKQSNNSSYHSYDDRQYDQQNRPYRGRGGSGGGGGRRY